MNSNKPIGPGVEDGFRILDSHIHLWPGTATQLENHGWMTPGHRLAKQYSIEDYLKVTNPRPHGFVYVETDRWLFSLVPGIDDDDEPEEKRKKLSKWAEEPIKELQFLRRIVEGKPEVGDGFSSGNGDLMKGCVIWAPCHLPHPYFQMYLSITQNIAGPTLWDRVVGFRYLLQGKARGEVNRLVGSEAWLENMMYLRKGREGKGWAFDVGIDTHRDGMEILEEVVGMIQQVRKSEAAEVRSEGTVRFILNHLNKPPLSNSPPAQLMTRYHTVLSTLSDDRDVYVKLSGAFNEISNNQPSPDGIVSMISMLHPWTDIVFAAFPHRVLFGSDWPVCNVGGPKGEGGNWTFWTDIVKQLTQDFSEEEREWVWWRAVARAYAIKS